MYLYPVFNKRGVGSSQDWSTFWCCLQGVFPSSYASFAFTLFIIDAQQMVFIYLDTIYLLRCGRCNQVYLFDGLLQLMAPSIRNLPCLIWSILRCLHISKSSSRLSRTIVKLHIIIKNTYHYYLEASNDMYLISIKKKVKTT